MPVDDAPADDDVRQTYNFAPGSYGLVYRADVPDYGAGPRHHNDTGFELSTDVNEVVDSQAEDLTKVRYKLQAMKWGLVPFWTKRNPNYSSVMKTINARDDSLASKGGMWNTMKQKKRCIVVAQGFYEWLKKNGGNQKIPHYTKRRDEQLMCFAGLWDCVQYEGSNEKHYTYAIITTDSNKQLSFLHDRMPVILENGSDDIRTWLDPSRAEWSRELQSLLKPFPGELDCYPVSGDVGKVGNNSPTFIIPVASRKNKNNIANFFGNANMSAKGKDEQKGIKSEELEVKKKGTLVEHEEDETRVTMDCSGTENNAPMPVKSSTTKREREPSDDDIQPHAKTVKLEELLSLTKPQPDNSPPKRSRSATKNRTLKESPVKRSSDGSQKITNFYK